MTKKNKRIEDLTKELLSKMKIEHTIVVVEEPENIYINIETEDSPLLIGRYGETLMSLEHILKTIYQKEMNFDLSAPRFVLDVSGYRKNQIEKIKEMAKYNAEKVLKYKQAEVLRPMNAYERRTVHMILKDFDQLTTESIGIDPDRRIVIRMK